MNSTVGAAVYREDGIRIYGLDAELEKKVLFFLAYMYVNCWNSTTFMLMSLYLMAMRNSSNLKKCF